MEQDESSQQSQLDPLPTDLPFRIISKTIGRGAYASVKKAIPIEAREPVFAVKLINKAYAIKNGRISAKQIAMEVALHSHIGQHPNIIEWFAAGEDAAWRWIAMEYADGGDLFDKIQPDKGVSEDIAHVYFQQLISGVSFSHSKGIAHRDLKPENILLSGAGVLKIADFGMSTVFEHKGQRKLSATMCGSPPYVAPEVLICAHEKNSATPSKYAADLVDIWSCGVILFVLLVGNTPWDEPTRGSWEYQEYVRTQGHSSDALWARLPADVLSLLRGLISVDAKKRFSFAQIRQHPWFTRQNALLDDDGKVTDPIALATQMLEDLHIDLKAPTTQTRSQTDAMDIDSQGVEEWRSRLPATQPEVPINDVAFDWERPTLRTLGSHAIASTQPGARAKDTMGSRGTLGRGAFAALAEDPTMSQFSQSPGVPPSLTQRARRFRDVVPAYSLTRFFSHMPPALLVQMLSGALHKLNVPQANPPVDVQSEHVSTLKVKALDGRHQSLNGEILVDKLYLSESQELLEVRFVKTKGDPLEWRRFFRQVALLCKDAIYNSDN